MLAEAEKDKPILVIRVIWVVNELGAFVVKDGVGFFKGYTMLFLVKGFLFGKPNETPVQK